MASSIVKILEAASKVPAGRSSQDVVGQVTPGFKLFQSFFNSWLKLDLTTLAAALTILSTINGTIKGFQSVAMKIYWWITQFFTASISINSSDRLNREVLNWLGHLILTRQNTRILTARTETIQKDAYSPRRKEVERNDLSHEKRVPVQYLPTFGTTWFIKDRNVFIVKRIPATVRVAQAMGVPAEFAAAPEGDEPLLIMCLGRSVKPIKKFLDDCRDFAEKQRETFITVRASKSQYTNDLWDTTILRPLRPLETVHFDEKVKAELVADITNYLDPSTRRFYTSRGIPYRRGYLLHGDPGTGKTSLSLALAGRFGLELYLLHLPSIRDDKELERLFTALPPRCIVLLEDIDAVGMKRQPDKPDEDDEEEEKVKMSRCTLSGLLNVLDGVASQEGRIVLMTSNFAHKLDKALVRPGRIDKMIFLGNISQRSAELMFLRMFAPDDTTTSPLLANGSEMSVEELNKLALVFSGYIKEDIFTPAQLQGYLLDYRHSATLAASQIESWLREEKIKMDQAKVREKELSVWRAKKRKEDAQKALTKLEALRLDSATQRLLRMSPSVSESDVKDDKVISEKSPAGVLVDAESSEQKDVDVKKDMGVKNDVDVKVEPDGQVIDENTTASEPKVVPDSAIGGTITEDVTSATSL